MARKAAKKTTASSPGKKARRSRTDGKAVPKLEGLATSVVDMARRNPRTVADFAEINGVGEAKLRDFAQPFLEEIAFAYAAPPAGE